VEAESLLLVLELDHVAGLKKALQSYRGERVIFHGPSEFLARTGKKLGHGTQVSVKANRLRVNQLLDRAARIVGEVLFVNSWGCTPKPSKIPSNWISDFHSLVQPSFADTGSIFTATIPFVAEELRSISMRCWQTWHWKKATKGSLKCYGKLPDGIFEGLGVQPLNVPIPQEGSSV
jgi:hypothetical protein